MIWTILQYVRLAIGFGLLWAFFWVYSSYGCVRIDGSEMAPTVEKSKSHLLYLHSQPIGDLKRGDIVHYVHDIPKSGQKSFSGRVIGIPGDKISCDNGVMTVNGETIPKKYTIVGITGYGRVDDVIVPRNSVYVLGDNDRAAATCDSRAVGPIDIALIGGTLGE